MSIYIDPFSTTSMIYMSHVYNHSSPGGVFVQHFPTSEANDEFTDGAGSRATVEHGWYAYRNAVFAENGLV